ncbi:Ty3/Gypsy family RNase HI domain-containing protein [Sodalis sp.]|uniref:Ty3/Gypsy family RNase HI domain-containing protein n=1 Tax=Sodalis sp. (in: enterobacteria) TaxID=1898979 RepID=UPI0038738BE2
MGTLNNYRQFIPDMAEPLNDLLKKGRIVEITPVIEDNIRRCLKCLQEQSVLAFPDFNKTFTITTDASDYALGAVLSQESTEGDRPVAYASRRLTSAETRYGTLERELLGIVWAPENFRPYIFGRRFKVQTDHRPLQWVGKLKESSGRVTRDTNMEIQYRPGWNNVVADWLTRALMMNAINEDAGPSNDLRQFLRDWTPE